MSPDASTPAERAGAVLRAAEAAAAAARGAPAAPAGDDDPAAELLAATSELEAGLARARVQLDALDDALARLAPPQ